jgi:hypothetical protein
MVSICAIFEGPTYRPTAHLGETPMMSLIERWHFLCVAPMKQTFGVPTSPREIALWRAGGKWKFVLRNGSFAGFFCLALCYLEYFLGPERAIHNPSLIVLLTVFFLTAGPIWALLVWRGLEKRFGTNGLR